MKNKVWFVTGASKGLGLALVKKLLAEGYRVAATSRRADELQKAVGAAADTFLPLTVRLEDEADVEQGIRKAAEHFGSLDVIVNNAGYGLAGALEELSDAEARANFNINVFGSLNVIRKALPFLRRQRSGHIFNVSSIGGFSGAFPGFGIYCATKFAVQGLTESLAVEVKPFGIHATIVSPGYFRTDFLSAASFRVPENEIAEYENVRDAQSTHQHSYNGNQPGDPEKAAEVLIAIAELKEPPVHLFLGADAYALAEEKIGSVQRDMENVRAQATATAFAG